MAARRRPRRGGQVGAILALFNYPLTRGAVEAIQRRLARRQTADAGRRTT